MVDTNPTSESCLSIDESDPKFPSIDDARIQRNLSRIPQQLTQNLFSKYQLAKYCPVSRFLLSSVDHKRRDPMAAQEEVCDRSCLPLFGDLGVSMSASLSLPSKDLGPSEGRIATNTSEYFSEENRVSSENSTECTFKTKSEDVVVKDDEVTVRQPSPTSQSTGNEDIQTKRASLVKSKEVYSSIEYDPIRRGSILAGSRGDSVFSEDEISPAPRRRSRDRLIKQRSQSTSDLPDLVQSSPSPSPQSPDVVPFFDGPRVRSEEILVDLCNDINVNTINERISLERKQQIEGSVHDGTSAKHNFTRSVSFHDSPTVYDIPSQDTNSNNETYDCGNVPSSPCSTKGEQGRLFYRDMKSSGYGTGSSSKNSLQSQISNQTNLSDSVLTDPSVDQEDVEECQTLKYTETEDMPEMVPFLSIFGNPSMTMSVRGKSLNTDGLGDSLPNHHSEEHHSDKNSLVLNEDENIPNLSIFKPTGASNGSLVLKSSEFLPDMNEGENSGARVSHEAGSKEPEDSSSLHDEYAVRILNNQIEVGASASPDTRHEYQCKKSLTKDKGLHQMASRELIEHFAKLEHLDPVSLLAEIQKVLVPSDSSTPSPSMIDVDLQMFQRFMDPLPSPFEMGSESSHDKVDICVNEELKEMLERAARCQSTKCDDPECKKAKELLHGFDESIRSNSSLDKEQENVLLALRCHSERCDTIKCPVPHCHLLVKIDPWDKTEAICLISQQLDIILNITEAGVTPGRFLALSADCPHQGPVREGEDWIALAPLGNTHSVALISNLESLNQRLSALKKVPQLEDNHQWHVYSQIRQLSHPNVVKHSWVMEYGSDLLICTDFMKAGNLRQKLQDCQSSLPWKQIVSYMKQVIAGVQALHQRGIVYINWTSCNILLDDTGRVAKVSNLSMSANMDPSHNIDFGGIKDTLPPAILPPELIESKPHIYPVSDSWGCGCLLYELLLGHKVWYQYRHETKDFIWRKLQGRVPPIPQQLRRWPEVFQACWKYDYRMRSPLQHVVHLLDLTGHKQ